MRPLILLLGCALLTLPSPAIAGGWSTASDVGRDGLVIVALGLPIAEGDWHGTKQAGFSIGTAVMVTTALKETIPEQRPDASNDQSFPSGHASISFAAAATLYKRDGWEVGIPAHVVAVLVGIARVKADKHFVHDVIAGAAIGETTGWLLTNRRNGKMKWLPWGNAHGGGVTVAMRF